MTASRRPTRLTQVFVTAAVASSLATAGCGATATPAPSVSSPPAASPAPGGSATTVASASPSTGPSLGTSAEPSLTPVPGAPSTSPVALPSTTTTEFGTVWDALPPSWPKLREQSEPAIGSDASATLVVKGQPAALASELATALTLSGWTVDIGSPLEDGSVVVDATRSPAGCKAEARFMSDQPGSDTGTLVVYYGAACPFS